MSSSTTFQVEGYAPSGGGHWAATLKPTAPEILDGAPKTSGTTLWSTAADEGKVGLQRALLLPANEGLLGMLANRPAATADLRVREIGMASEVDVVAVLDEPDGAGRTVLLVTCDPVGVTKPSRLRAQYVRLLRSARCVLSNVSFGAPPPEPALVLLAAWRPDVELPRVATRPGWEATRLPRPAVWGYLPFVFEDREHVTFGRWAQLDADRSMRRVEQRNRAWFDGTLKGLTPSDHAMRRIEFRIDLGPGSGLEFLLDRGPFRAYLRVAAPKHRRALLPEGREDYQVRRIRSLRNAAYERSWAPTGWKFLGETVDDGSPCLVWQWAHAESRRRIDWVTANDEAERFAITMKMYVAGT